MYLIDTNVISEARKGRQVNPGVVRFFLTNRPRDRYLCVQTIGEIRRGIENVRKRGDWNKVMRLETWLDLVIREYADRILNFDVDCAQVWGGLMSPQAIHPVDRQVAAIALVHGLEVVTRNVHDFAATGAALFNPFV